MIEDWKQLREELHSLSERGGFACRGQAMDFGEGKLFASIDRTFQRLGLDQPLQIAIERMAYLRFLQDATTYLGASELLHLENGPNPLMFMRHFGAPTRLLDWTESPWIAAFNAAMGCWDKPGVIFLFRRQEFDDAVHSKFAEQTPLAMQTMLSGIGQFPSIMIHELHPWVCRLMHVGPRFPRVSVQQGFFTIGSRLGLDHWDFIHQMLPSNDQARVVRFSPALKPRILRELEAMGISDKSLFPGLDGIGRYCQSFSEYAHENPDVKHCAARGWSNLAPWPAK